MQADIFIPTSNRITALRQCLTSLDRQSTKDFQIFLVGLAYSLDVSPLVKEHPHLKIKYFIQGKPGIIGAANEALARSTKDLFVRLDDDVIVAKDWYRNLIATYKRFPRVGGVTGPTIMSEAGLKSRDLTSFLEKFSRSTNLFLRLLSWLYRDYLYEGKMFEVSRFLDSGVFTLGSNYSSCLLLKEIRDVDTLEACNWYCRRKLLIRVGGFDNAFIRGLGDYHEADIPFKIKKLGYRIVFNPQVKLRHNVEMGKVDKARQAAFYRIQNFIIFYFRHIRPNSLTKISKFITNLLLQNLYYCYRFLTTGDISLLGSIPGTIVGLTRAIAILVSSQEIHKTVN